MGFVMANHGMYVLLSTAVSGAFDLRCLVCSTAGSPTDAQLEDLNFVSELASVGLVEPTNVNYSRQDLAGVAVQEDDLTNKVVLIADPPLLPNVGVGDVWKRVVYYVEGASDAARPIIGVDTPANVLTPNGADVILPSLRIELVDVSP